MKKLITVAILMAGLSLQAYDIHQSKMMKLFLVILFITSTLVADCVYGAKDKTKYTKLDNHSVVLQGGYGNNILIKTYCPIYGSSEVQVLKDDFCSYDSAVLYIDGQVCDANQVSKI